MADTARSRTALQSVLADNTSGDISPQDLRDLLVSVFGGYGGLYCTAGASAQACTSTPAKLTSWNGTFTSTDLTCSSSTDDITATVDSVVRASVSIAFTSGTATAVTFQIYKNGSAVTGAKSVSTVADTSETMAAHIDAVVSVSASDVITVYVSTAASANVTVQEAQLVLSRLA